MSIFPGLHEKNCRMKISYMKINKNVCPKMYMYENPMHKIVQSPTSHEHFWGKGIIGVDFVFKMIIFMHGNDISARLTLMRENKIEIELQA